MRLGRSWPHRPPRGSCALLAIAVGLGATDARAGDVNATPADYKAKIGSLKPGDTLRLSAGTYAHFGVSGLNGTASAWITITGPETGAPAVVEADPGPCCNTIEIADSSYVAIKHLTIDGKNIDGAFGISAKSGVVHDVLVEQNDIVNHHGSQQHDAISTKVATWGWIIRNNRIRNPGTGLYLGNSDGSAPFIDGLIEGNLVENPIGYCMEIKFQNARPTVAGMPTQPTSTIIRRNVFIKNDDASPDGDRPNVLVGGFPASGAGSQDRYEIYGNIFMHNARESLLQASGRVTVHDNLFVDAPGQSAVTLTNHDLPLEQAFVYDNTVFSVATGIRFGASAPQGDAVVGNLIFADTPVAGPIANLHDNLTDSSANAAGYVKRAATTLDQMDFFPLAGKCKGPPLDMATFVNDADYGLDFNGRPRAKFEHRGAYEGDGQNPGASDGGATAPADASPPAPGAPGGENGGSASASGGSTNGAASDEPASGCGCAAVDRRGVAGGWLLAALCFVLRARRRGRRLR